jgi:predicted enzyme related to lactoylglutathione lyase
MTGHIAFLGVNNLAAARPFYEEKLGLTFAGEEVDTLVFDMAGTALRITEVEKFKPQRFTVLGWAVPDLDAAATSLKASGIIPISYPHIQQDANGIATLGAARLLWFTDPAGNVLSLTETPD